MFCLLSLKSDVYDPRNRFDKGKRVFLNECQGTRRSTAGDRHYGTVSQNNYGYTDFPR